MLQFILLPQNIMFFFLTELGTLYIIKEWILFMHTLSSSWYKLVCYIKKKKENL